MRPSKAPLVIPVLLTLFPALAFAVQPDRITGALDSSQRVTLAGHIHPNAQPRYDQGAVEPSFRLDYVSLMTVPSPSQQRTLDRLLLEQQDRSSSNYHRWLTPEQYADRFGLSQADTQKITDWLKSQGLKIERIARGRNWIAFSGNALQIQNAFQAEIHRYNVEGEMHFANTTAPTIPSALRGIVTGLRGLHDFRPKPLGIARNTRLRPFYNSSTFGDLIAPGDVATIYDLKPLYAAGINGTGQKLAVAGQSDIYLADIADFRTGFGLSPINCTTNSSDVITACNTNNFKYVLGGSDPGVSKSGDLSEADLDIEWSGATAPNAQIIFVNSNNAFTSYYFAIDNQLAPVISLSYGLCELQDAGFLAADEAELKKGNSFGITIVNSSGDVGVAECENGGSTIATTGLAVSYPASSPEVTSVGGTAIPLANVSSSTYWGTTNGTDGGTALSYVPETSWNDDEEIAQSCKANPTSFCTTGNGTGTPITSAATAQHAIGISSSGGGVSNCATTNGSNVCTAGFQQPSWQTVSISGQPSARFSPDVSLLASPNFLGYIFCTQLSELGDTGSGSSCAPGGAAGITNALSRSNSSGPTPSIIGGTSVSAPVFAGIVALLNQFLQGSTAGLGNINQQLYSLAKTPSNNAFHPVTSGDNTVYCTAGTPSTQPVALRCPSGGSFGYSASSADATTGYNLVTGLGSVDAHNLAIAWAGTSKSFTLTPSSATLTVQPGQSTSNTVNLTVASPNGFVVTTGGNEATVLPLSYSCTVSPAASEAPTCTFSPSSGQDVTVTNPTVAIITIAPTAKLLRPLEHRAPIFYAIMLPGILGIALAASGSGRRPCRLLGLLAILAFSSLWLVACGGSNNRQKDPGTPAGNYTVKVNATTGGASPIQNSTSFTVTVQ